jgi:hypothetical protein
VRLLADHCDLYNAALIERREAWRIRQVGIRYGAQSAQLKGHPPRRPDGQGRHSFTAQQQTLRRLDAVFAAFFVRLRAAGNGEGKKPGIRGSSRTSGSARCYSLTVTAPDGGRLARTDGRMPRSWPPRPR